MKHRNPHEASAYLRAVNCRLGWTQIPPSAIVMEPAIVWFSGDFMEGTFLLAEATDASARFLALADVVRRTYTCSARNLGLVQRAVDKPGGRPLQ